MALKTPDRVPVVPNGPAWPGRALGVKMSDIATNPAVSYRTIIDAYTGLGEIDGIQSPAYHVCTLSIQWLSRVKVPGRDLPDDELWQVDEAEIMTLDDYDAIVDEGFGPWLDRYYAERLPGTARGVRRLRADHPRRSGAVPGEGRGAVHPGGRHHPLRVLLRRALHEGVPARPLPPRRQGAGGHGRGSARAHREHARSHPRSRISWVCGSAAGARPASSSRPGCGTASSSPTSRRWWRPPWRRAPSRCCTSTPTGPATSSACRELPKGKCVLSLDGKTDIFKAKEILGDHMCIMGDVPPGMFALGTPEEVTAYCKRLISEIGPAGFILSSGCDVPIDARYENVKAMVEAVL